MPHPPPGKPVGPRTLPKNDISGNTPRKNYLSTYRSVQPKLISLYQDTASLLAEKIRQFDLKGQPPPSQLLSLRQSLFEQYTEIVNPEVGLITNWMVDSLDNGAAVSQFETAAAIGVSPNLLNVTIDDSMAIAIARGDVTSRFLFTGNPDGISLADRVWSNVNRDFDKIFGEVQRRTLLGESSTKIARSIVQLTSGKDHKGYTAWKSALRLARTEMAQTFRAGQIQYYNQINFIEAVEWELSLSHRASGCQCERNAREDFFGLGVGVYPKDNVPQIPHPHCLCWLKPKISDEALEDIGLTPEDR